jgi:hypothetical protein
MKIKGLAATIRDLDAMLKVVSRRAETAALTSFKKEKWLLDAYWEIEDAIAGLELVRGSEWNNYPPPCNKCGQSLPEDD